MEAQGSVSRAVIIIAEAFYSAFPLGSLCYILFILPTFLGSWQRSHQDH